MPVLWSLLLLTGCGTADAPPEEAAEQATEEGPDEEALQRLGWISEVALAPDRFAALTETSRDGWVALHAHDYASAAKAFESDDLGRARAAFALGILHADLARLSGLVNEQLYSEWDQRSELPKGNGAPLMAALASYCADGDTTAIWAGRVEDGPGSGIARTLTQGRNLFDVRGNDPVAQRMGLHLKARRGDVAPLESAALDPLLTMDEGEDFEREFWDPCIHRSLSEGWFTVASAALGGASWRSMERLADGEPLGGRIFGAVLTADDLRTELSTVEQPGVVGARSPSLRRLGLGATTSASDDVEVAREEVRLLDQALEQWRTELAAEATPEGQALLADLALIDRFRQEWLITRARAALQDGHPRQALAVLDMARDVTIRSVGVRNAPALLALMAEAHLRLGHTREALDPLQLLIEAHPSILGLRETLADLAVLQGVDRTGDSKEAQ